jgi:hypothetical protein
MMFPPPVEKQLAFAFVVHKVSSPFRLEFLFFFCLSFSEANFVRF